MKSIYKMKINELRFGNWVTDAHGNPVRIQGIISEMNTAGYNLDTLKPIPLNPEILERAGFEKDNTSQYGGYLIGVGEGEKLRVIYDKSNGWHWPMNGYRRPKCNYLHQLQNLYSALTNEELQINF